jgi:hypothetical protein
LFPAEETKEACARAAGQRLQPLDHHQATIMAPLTIICVLGGPVDEEGVPKEHLSLRLDQALAEGVRLRAMGTPHKYLAPGAYIGQNPTIYP